MSGAGLDELQIAHPTVRERLSSGRIEQAGGVATRQLAEALCDVAVVELGMGKLESAVRKFQDALNACPSCRAAFHNLSASLLRAGALRDKNLFSLQQFIRRFWNELPWIQDYRRLLYMPHFVTVNFVGGKCNLKCRMCESARHPNPAGRLLHISAEDFRQTLSIAPTAGGVTLSAGDSEPLLHPQLEQILDLARQHRVVLDMFTNGLPLTPDRCRRIVESQAVQMMNFSLDAATAETYQRIRGADFARVIANIEMLLALRRERGLDRPWISISLVAMADNIQELPDLVTLAARLGARRVYVEALDGWQDDPGGNHPATGHPQCAEFVRQAQARATATGVFLQLPAFLRSGTQPTSAAGTQPAQALLPHCSWLAGVQVQMDGRLDPCCLVTNAADMGTIHDGPLLQNEKYARVKDLLLTGKVFKACARHQNCEYVQQQLAAGRKLRTITSDELGELYRDPEAQPAAGTGRPPPAAESN